MGKFKEMSIQDEPVQDRDADELDLDAMSERPSLSEAEMLDLQIRTIKRELERLAAYMERESHNPSEGYILWTIRRLIRNYC